MADKYTGSDPSDQNNGEKLPENQLNTDPKLKAPDLEEHPKESASNLKDAQKTSASDLKDDPKSDAPDLKEVSKTSASDLKAEREALRKRRTRRRRARIIVSTVLVALVLLAAFGAIAYSQRANRKNADAAESMERASRIEAEEAEIQAKRDLIAEAQEIAEGYDYDAAIALLSAEPDAATDSEIKNAITQLTAEKATLEVKECSTVPHIFFHSLIVDPERCFDSSLWEEREINGMNAWMVTIDEFDKIIQSLYDNGWVLVRMRDLVTETTDADGTIHFSKNTELLLPADKKPLVLSVDDWSYYHTYEGKGLADKAVLDENGEVKVEYTDADGNTDVGDYDVVPRLETFLKDHPDFSYKGARGLLAMTGYNGVFGYRTDVAYKTGDNLDKIQQEWLDAHPDFSWDEDVAEATRIADALKDEGWEFACHTWGHLSVTDRTVDDLKTDYEKWLNTVANITGTSDTIIFAHGADIGNWHYYDAATNDKYAYYKSEGYNFYANVDASAPYWIQIRDDYVRQGRIDIDGMQMWRHLSGAASTDVLSQFFNVDDVFDERRPTPVTAVGKA